MQQADEGIHPSVSKQIKILVVDDNADLRELLVMDLQSQGFEVTEAADGNEALESLRLKPVDLVLSDIRMPVCDGIGLIRAIKEMNPALPRVIFLTGFADVTLEEVCDLGVEAMFSKPFEREEMIKAIHKAVTPRRVAWTAPEEDARAQAGTLLADLNLPAWESPVCAEVVNIGQGGLFLALPHDKVPRVGAECGFSLRFEQGPPVLIEGKAVVRWVRLAEVEGRPAGCGLEFVSLSGKCIDDVIDLIKRLGVRAFIPRSLP